MRFFLVCMLGRYCDEWEYEVMEVRIRPTRKYIGSLCEQVPIRTDDAMALLLKRNSTHGA